MGRRTDLAYSALAATVGPFVALHLAANRRWPASFRPAFGYADALGQVPGSRVLLHGASVGEVSSSRPLLEVLSADQQVSPVVSSMTETGVERARELYGPDVPIVRYPFDFSWMVRRFLDQVNPDAVALIELEVWPNFTEECVARGIPLGVVNGRLSERAFRRYKRIRRWITPAFGRLSVASVQTDLYAARFAELGVPEARIQVSDNLKWDATPIRDDVEGGVALQEALGIDPSRPLIVAGSTGPDEERLLLSRKPDGVQLMIVPRRPGRFDEVASLDPRFVRRSNYTDGRTRGVDGAELFLLDSMGELDAAYSLADVAVVGRSFMDLGGSDPIPPVALGKPTIVGPHHTNFEDIVHALQQHGGIRVALDPMTIAAELLEDSSAAQEMVSRGREVIRGRQGASQRNADVVRGLLERREKH